MEKSDIVHQTYFQALYAMRQCVAEHSARTLIESWDLVLEYLSSTR